ncbi:MAG: hypothetical protein AB4352_13820 [Hormoscilla sp.]
MKKFLMAAGTDVLLSNVAIAPAFADSLSSEIEPETQNQIVLPEGAMMTDAELAEIEGSMGGRPMGGQQGGPGMGGQQGGPGMGSQQGGQARGQQMGGPGMGGRQRGFSSRQRW